MTRDRVPLRLAATALFVLVAAVLSTIAAGAERLVSGADVMERAVKAAYYPGSDARARLLMEIEETGGSKRYRRMTALRLNLPEGEQFYLLYFHEPGDVRRMTCMVKKHVGLNDDRWIYVPLANQIRPVTAPERSRFLGSDFVREDFSGRDAAADSHRVVGWEKQSGRHCYVVESIPRQRGAEFARYTSWIDASNFLPLRQEYRDERGEVLRVFTAEKVAEIRGVDGVRYPTPLVRTMADGSGTRRTRMIYESIAYDVGLKESDFSEEHMRQQLSDWFPEPPAKQAKNR